MIELSTCCKFPRNQFQNNCTSDRTMVAARIIPRFDHRIPNSMTRREYVWHIVVITQCSHVSSHKVADPFISLLQRSLAAHRCRSATKTTQSIWHAPSFQDFNMVHTNCQALKIAWQSHSLQGMAKAGANCQTLKTIWQSHPLQVFVEILFKCQTLQTAR